MNKRKNISNHISPAKTILCAVLASAAASSCIVLTGCDSQVIDKFNSFISDVESFGNQFESEFNQSEGETESGYDDSDPFNESYGDESSRKESQSTATATYTMSDIYKLSNTDYFADGTLEHIFDGTINKSGKATGYHYTMVTDSKGSIIEGTRSEPDENGVFTAKVTVSGKKKDGFSSFYPESWSPQKVVNAINTAYNEAIDENNRSGSLWIGHYGDIEIDMYLDNNMKITTAYPVYEGD